MAHIYMYIYTRPGPPNSLPTPVCIYSIRNNQTLTSFWSPMEEIIGNTAALEVAVPTSLEGAIPETQEVVPEPHDAVPAPMHLLPPRMHVVEDALEYIFRFMNGVHEEHMLE